MSEKYNKRFGKRVAKKASRPGVYKVHPSDGAKWYVRARAKHPRTSKLVEVSRFLKTGSAAEAYETLQQLLQDKLGTGKRQQTTFAQYARDLQSRKLLVGEIKSAAGKEKWNNSLNRWLIPTFGDYYLDKLERQDIQDWLLDQAKKVSAGKYKPTTINGHLAILKVILNTATLDLDLPRNPVQGIKPLDTSDHRTYTEEEPNALHPEDVARFLGELRLRYSQHYAMAALGLATGLRPSHMRPLRRRGPESDIKWQQGLLLVRRSHSRQQEVMNRTKTAKDQRIALPPKLMDILKWHRDTQLRLGAQTHSDLLFPSRTGGYRSPSCLDKPFRAICKVLKLPYGFSPRGMRRTYQDLMRAEEISDVVVRSISGHATEEMQQRYSTVSADEQRQALGKVVQLFG